MGHTMTWPWVNVLFQMPQVVSLRTIHTKNRATTHSMFPINKKKRSVSLFVDSISGGATAINIIQVLVIFHNRDFSFCVPFQERLQYRNGDFHATHDARGRTQRAKRSPGKESETGASRLRFLLILSSRPVM